MSNTSQATDLTLPCLVHDLNNVFQTLVEAADLLSGDPRWAPVSAVILRSIERGKGITASLHSVEQPAPFETILQNAIAFAEDSLLVGKGPRVRFACDVEPGIELQRTWAWERVLINLFLNAIRAMPDGGTIHVSARVREGMTEHEGVAEIVVRDDGPGIAPEILEGIFHPAVSTKQKGGLGLHIVETIVKQDDGEVRAFNRADGRGAEFIIMLPIIRPVAMVPSAIPAHA